MVSREVRKKTSTLKNAIREISDECRKENKKPAEIFLFCEFE